MTATVAVAGATRRTRGVIEVEGIFVLDWADQAAVLRQERDTLLLERALLVGQRAHLTGEIEALAAVAANQRERIADLEADRAAALELALSRRRRPSTFAACWALLWLALCALGERLARTSAMAWRWVAGEGEPSTGWVVLSGLVIAMVMIAFL